MATLASLAGRYDPNSPDYDPNAVLTQNGQPPVTAPTLAPATGTPAPVDNMAAAKAITDANKATATTQQYNESTGVAGRVNALTSGGGPLMQTARTQAAQTAAQRGLVNSSLGVQAGEQAVINTATPIATADAQLTSQQNLANQTATNNASTTNAQLGVTAGVQGMSLAQQAQQFGVTTGNQAAQFAQNLGMQQQQVDAQISQFAQSLGIQVSDLSLRRDTLTAQQQQALDQLTLQRSQLAQQQSQFTASQGQQGAQFQATQAQQLVMQNADNETKTALAQLQAANQASISGNTNIANAWGTMMQSINAVQNNSAFDAGTKNQLIKNLTGGFQSFADFWHGTTGIDVGPLLNFNVTSTDDPNRPGGGSNAAYDPSLGPPSTETPA